jgi:hypothetical protein
MVTGLQLDRFEADVNPGGAWREIAQVIVGIVSPPSFAAF